MCTRVVPKYADYSVFRKLKNQALLMARIHSRLLLIKYELLTRNVSVFFLTN